MRSGRYRDLEQFDRPSQIGAVLEQSLKRGQATRDSLGVIETIDTEKQFQAAQGYVVVASGITRRVLVLGIQPHRVGSNRVASETYLSAISDYRCISAAVLGQHA